MTWSIVARDPASGAFGVGVATRFLAAAGLCALARSEVGALSTQALINPTYGPRGLAILSAGASAETTVRILVTDDAGRETRQVHVVDRQGGAFAHTGSECVPWSGHVSTPGVSVAGNMLAGPDVIAATLAAYQAAPKLAFADRLLTALEAGQAAGGDRRGQQSASLLIYGTEDYPDLSLRVDDHVTPLAELRRIYGLWLGRFAAFRTFMATKADPVGVYDRDVIEAEALRREALRGRVQN